jgi:hypothetical protein
MPTEIRFEAVGKPSEAAYDGSVDVTIAAIGSSGGVMATGKATMWPNSETRTYDTVGEVTHWLDQELIDCVGNDRRAIARIEIAAREACRYLSGF